MAFEPGEAVLCDGERGWDVCWGSSTQLGLPWETVPQHSARKAERDNIEGCEFVKDKTHAKPALHQLSGNARGFIHPDEDQLLK